MKSPWFRFVLLLACLSMWPMAAWSQTESTEPLAIQYYQNGEYDKAVVLFGVLFDKRPEPRFYNYYFDCLMQLEDYKTAEKLVVKQQRKHPDDPRYYVDLGFVFQKSGNDKDAEKQFDLAIRNAYPDRQGFIDVSNAFLLRNLPSYAVKTLLKGKKTLRYEPQLNIDLAEVYLKTGAFTEALAEYLDLLEQGGEYIATVQNKLQDMLAEDPDQSRNEKFKAEVLDRIRRMPDKTIYSELLLWYFIQQKDFAGAFIQARALDKRMNEDGQRVYSLGRLAVDNGAYDTGIECFNYVIQRGEFSPYWYSARIDLMDARYLKITRSLTYTQDDLLQLEKEYTAVLGEMGHSNQTVGLVRNLAHLQAFYLSKIPEATALLQEMITMPGVQPLKTAECKLELADILLMSGDVWEATLLYSQVEKAFKNDPIGHEAKFRNAKLSFYIGEFEWSKAQLDVLKAATSKLIANDAMELSLLISDNIGEDSSTLALQMYARADLLIFRNLPDEALKTLDSIRILEMYHPLFDEVLFKKAEIYLARRDYRMADTLLRQLYEYYPDDILGDDALYKLAQLQEDVFGNRERAKELYMELMQRYPGSLYVVEARQRFRSLRGDGINP